jgi:hypothetical protein
MGVIPEWVGPGRQSMEKSSGASKVKAGSKNSALTVPKVVPDQPVMSSQPSSSGADDVVPLSSEDSVVVVVVGAAVVVVPSVAPSAGSAISSVEQDVASNISAMARAVVVLAQVLVMKGSCPRFAPCSRTDVDESVAVTQIDRQKPITPHDYRVCGSS